MPSAGRVYWAKFRVVAVALAAAAILGTITYLLTGGSLLEQRSTIYLYIPDATGLQKGSPVRYDNITVGKVDSVALSGSSEHARVVKVTLHILRETLETMPVDCYAQISSDTLVGDKYVDIRGGASPQRLRPDAVLAFKDEPDLFTSVDLTQFTRQLRLIDATLADIEQGRSQFGKFVQGTEFYNDLIRRLRDLHTAFHNAVNTTTDLGGFLLTGRMHSQAGQLLTDIDATLAKFQSGQGAGSLLRDSAQYDQALDNVRRLRASIANLQRSDWLQSDTSYKAWIQNVAAFSQKVDTFNRDPLMSSTAVYDNLAGAALELRDTMRDFRQNPRKFLRMKVF